MCKLFRQRNRKKPFGAREFKKRFYAKDARLNFLSLSEREKTVDPEAFSRLRLKPGVDLKLHVASRKTHGLGDTSYLYATTHNGTDRMNLGNAFLVNAKACDIWNLYLLMNAETFLPTWWHGRCVQRTYLFGMADQKQIKPRRKVDMSKIDESLLMPRCTISDNGDESFTADLHVCCWNDWRGPLRDHVRVSVENNSLTSFEYISQDILYKYNCRIVI